MIKEKDDFQQSFINQSEIGKEKTLVPTLKDWLEKHMAKVNQKDKETDTEKTKKHTAKDQKPGDGAGLHLF